MGRESSTRFKLGCLIPFVLVTALTIFLHLETYAPLIYLSFLLVWIAALVLFWLARRLVNVRDSTSDRRKTSTGLFTTTLRRLLLLIAAFSFLFGSVAWRRHEARERNEFYDSMFERRAITETTISRAFMWPLIADYDVYQATFCRGTYTDDELRRFKELFPETEISFTSEPRTNFFLFPTRDDANVP